jgi:hypothetical protein
MFSSYHSSLVAAYFVNVNYFSLNAMYRNRLVRAFLGASNIKAITQAEPVRDRFDGVSPNDNLAMYELRKEGPFHVINMTLNVTKTDNKAWQERKADSFISTPLHTGGNLVGYRESKGYAGGITLGTMMSLSGAAVSPSWGYHISTVTSFVMTLFNVRLGQWLGNPKDADAWKTDGPKKDGAYSYRKPSGSRRLTSLTSTYLTGVTLITWASTR